MIEKRAVTENNIAQRQRRAEARLLLMDSLLFSLLMRLLINLQYFFVYRLLNLHRLELFPEPVCA